MRRLQFSAAEDILLMKFATSLYDRGETLHRTFRILRPLFAGRAAVGHVVVEVCCREVRAVGERAGVVEHDGRGEDGDGGKMCGQCGFCLLERLVVVADVDRGAVCSVH